ncbi:MAG: ABC-type multidrug transport system, permease component [uncultured archaeon A07HB70]|nr:MAG: ABC-type multidrug transport system, permease component [uncultured archaeon A07HB70]
MTRLRRLRAEFTAERRSFLRRRTAVFFTFVFPLLIVLIFGVLVQTDGGGVGLFARPPAFYVPGYLAVVVLFTPLSRVGSTVARHRDGARFEKLATTPLRRWEWLLAHATVNAAVIGLAALLLFVLTLLLTGVAVAPAPALLLLVPLVTLATILFCGVGCVVGRVAGSQDGVIAASNALALPLLFLSETFVAADQLPAWFRPAVGLSPLTYFARGVRALVDSGDPAVGVALTNLAAVAALAVVAVAAGAAAVPRTD